MTTPNLPQIVPTVTHSETLLVQTTRPLRAALTGAIIPAGTFGKILSTDNQIYTIDFGLKHVHRLPATSTVIREVRA